MLSQILSYKLTNARYTFLVNNVAKYSLVLLGINWKYNPHFLFRKYTWKLHLIVFLKSNILQDISLKSDSKWVVILRSVSCILKWSCLLQRQVRLSYQNYCICKTKNEILDTILFNLIKQHRVYIILTIAYKNTVLCIQHTVQYI